MAFQLFAYVKVPTYKIDRQTGLPTFVSPITRCRRIFINTYPTRNDANWWAINIKRVWIDGAKTTLVPEHMILGFQVVEVP